MFCKIFFFLDYQDADKLEQHISSFSKNFKIITNNMLLRERLQKQGFQIMDLSEIFPENDPKLWKINDISKSNLANLKANFKDFNYLNCDLFITLENQILYELILIQKALEIMKNVENTLFIFDGFTYSYFEILKIAKNLDYEIDVNIYQIKGGKIISYVSTDKSLLKIKTNIKISQLLTKQKSSSNNTKKSKLMLNPKYKKFFNLGKRGSKIYLYKSLPFNQNLQNKILSSTLKKATALFQQTTSRCAFCFTLKRMDILNGIFPVIEKIKSSTMPFIFTFDYYSANLLQQKNISFVDFTDDVLILSEIFQHTDDGKKLAFEFKEIAKKQSDVSLLRLDGFIEQILNEFFKAISIILICKKIFESFKLQSIVISDDVTRNGNAVISIAKKFNITSYVIPVLLIDANPIGQDFYHADKICIYGEQGLNSLLELGYSRENIIVTGNPKYDNLKKLTQNESKQILAKKFGIKSDRYLITIAMTRWHKNDEKWIANFIKFCDKNKLTLVIKLHPMYKRVFKDYSDNKINYIKQKCKTENYLINFDVDLSTLLSASDLLITDYSNTGVEAVLLKKPLITVNFAHENLQNQQRFFEHGASLHLENYNELEDIINQFLSSEKVFDFELGYNNMVSNYNYNNDGKSSERISKILLS